MSDTRTSSCGVGFAGLLTIAFIVLKLCKVIDWSWWWVVSPMLISIGIVCFILGSIGLYYLCKYFKKMRLSKIRNKERTDEIKRLQDRASDLYDSINKVAPKSKWQQRMEEMQEAQKRAARK